ncbi:MAG: autotransporter domain-containing protein, partial [Caulobacter sp.]
GGVDGIGDAVGSDRRVGRAHHRAGAAAAAAPDACGPLDAGSVVCAPDAPIGTDGVAYSIDAPAPPQDLTVVLSEGLAIDTSGTDNNGVTATNSSGGSVTISGAGGSVTTDGSRAIGVRAVSTDGALDITLGDVTTLGYRSDGVSASTNETSTGGDIRIVANSVLTAGEASTGVRAETQYADIAVDVGSIITLGYGSDALYAASHYGNAAVKLGYVETDGDGGRGVVVYSAGATTVTAQGVYTFGAGTGRDFDAGAIKAVGTSVTVDVGTVFTGGDHSVGIYANSNHVVYDPTIIDPDIKITAEVVQTRGYVSDAVIAINDAPGGKVGIDIGRISTQGDYAFGVYARAYGDIDVDVDTLTTAGTVGRAIDIVGLGGDITVTAGAITTSGVAGSGVTLLNYSHEGVNTIDVGSVKTSRDYAGAIRAEAYGDIRVSADTISTSGFESMGVSAVSIEGAIDVNVGEITTHGLRSSAIDVVAYTGAITIDAGKITATGDQSSGVYAMGNGAITIHADTVATSGRTGIGIGAIGFGGQPVEVTAGTITTSGPGAAGLVAVSYGGALKVRVDKVVTTGPVAGPSTSAGVRLKASEGVMDAVIGEVSTKGDFSIGVHASASIADSHIVLERSITTAGRSATGMLISQEFADTVVDVKGTVTTTGQSAQAVHGLVTGGDMTINAAGAITTSGANAFGIAVEATSFGRGPEAYYGETQPYIYDGTVHITAASVTTSGAGADAIRVATDHILDYADSPIITHQVTIVTGTVAVTGEGARGIVVDSLGAISVDAGATRSATSNAIALSADTTAQLNIRGATVSGASDAVVVEGREVAVTIASGGSVSGAVDGLVLTGLDAPEPAGITALAAAAGGSVSLTNAGTIQGGSGYAVRVEQGVATIANSGTLSGAISLADGDDTVTNTGTFAAAGDSDFGDGGDRFVNSGVLTVRAGAAGPGSVTFLGLERFENAGGLVDLRNGKAGDVLTLPGDYVASGDARLGLDVSATAADSLVVVGAATGKTSILLAGLTPDQAVLTTGGRVLVKTGPGSASDAFTVANAEIGFIRYALKYDAAAGGYALVGQAGSAAYRTVKVASTAQDVWDKAAQGVSGRFAAVRDAGETDGHVWGQVFAASDKREDSRQVVDGAGQNQTFSLDYRTDYNGFQAGADLLRKPLGGTELTVGLTAGYLKSELAFDRTAQKTTFDSFNLGAYAGATHGVLYGNLLAQYARHDVSLRDDGYAADLDGTSWGAQLEAGARLPAGMLTFEPNLGLTYVRSDLDTLRALGQTIDFD